MYTRAELAGRWQQIKGAVIIAALVALLCLVSPGCRHWNAKPVAQVMGEDPTPTISEPLVRAQVRREQAVSQIELALPQVNGEPRTHIEVGRAALKAQGSDLQDARKGVENVTADRNHIADAYNDVTKQLDHLRGQWYVRCGVWIERSLWTIGIGWLVLNIVAFAGGIGSPGGWLAWVAKQIRLFLPAMNVSSWLLAWKGTKTDARLTRGVK
jgi:hypothetical protein